MPQDEAVLAQAAHRVITALAGPDARVRDDQLAAVRALVVGRRRALVVQATGWGKSAVYWIAARALRDAGSGPVLVVSPLLALMRDQLDAATRAGLSAITLNSSNVEQWAQAEAAVLAGEVDVLLVSPERLANPRFAATVLGPLLPRLGLLVIDEAHCISSWGHDFRPDYQRIARLLLANPSLPVLATTATANRRVTADVAAQLGPDTLVQRGLLARDSLHLSVVPGLDPVARYAWVDEALAHLPGSGIVYVLTVAEAERLAGFLAARGHAAAAYTGQLDATERALVERRLRCNEVKVVVATSALGMGYDKPDLAFCLHVGSPGSPVDYYQQVGRAGRALASAIVALLPGESDERLWAYFATASIPDPDVAARVLEVLRDAGG
ncbi:MAG: DEAD/DEAH box helicase, partial [Actinomycetes bacterium]